MSQSITLSATPGLFAQTLYYSQGDIGREFIITVEGFTIPSGATVQCVATKPSGFGFTVSGVVSDQTVTFTTTEAMTDEWGRFPAELRITHGDDVIGTANFYLQGEANPHPDGTTDGQQETIIPQLTLLVERVETAASNVLDMTVTATTLAAGSDATYSYDEETNTATFGIPRGADGSLASGVLAPTYSASATYSVGEYVYYSGDLYRCTTEISTAEAWTAGHWTEVALADEVASAKKDITTLQNGGYVADQQQIAENIDDWLTAHPEATTTVQDGAITEDKLADALKLKTIKDYVTPEMYGAVGDGVADDTAAWQTAVDIGVPVIATKNIYKCGQINVTKNIIIDCNNAKFICTGDRLFYFSGEIIETVTGERDYSANKSYTIANANYSNYTGFAMLKGTNNFEQSRAYYYGGFVCTFKEGELCGSYPIDATSVSLEIINPITCELKNIGGVTHVSPTTTTKSIEILYGYGCKVENVKIENGSSYMVLALSSCLNCHITNLNISHGFTSSNNNSYIVAFMDSSFCALTNSYLFNKLWHCVTTGGNYLCYSNIIKDSTLNVMSGYAFGDHMNALNTIMENCTLSQGACFGGLCVVRNITITPQHYTGVSPHCLIILSPISNRDNAVYNLSDVNLINDGTVPTSGMGVIFGNDVQVNGNTYYITNCILKNVLESGAAYNSQSGRMIFDFSSASNYIIDTISVDNTNLAVNLGKTSTQNNIDISGYTLYVFNLTTKNNISRFPNVGYITYHFNKVYLDNVRAHIVGGVIDTLIFSNLTVSSVLGLSNLSVSNSLRGSGLHSRFNSDLLLNPASLAITDMFYNASATYFNIGKDANGNGKAYYQYWYNGTLTTREITA